MKENPKYNVKTYIPKAAFWKKPFGKCDIKYIMPEDCFDIEGIDNALEDIDR